MNQISSLPKGDLAAMLEDFQELPILYGDESEIDMGESNLHSLSEDIFRYGMAAHLASQPQYRVFANLNLHFQPKFPRVFIAPDAMVVTPLAPLPDDVSSYYVD